MIRIEKIDLDLGRANISIFKGNMDDFCKAYPNGKYDIAGDFFTNSVPHLVCNLPKQTKLELLNLGYAGLINADLHRFLLLFGYYTGLPIKKIINARENSLPFNESQF